MVFNDGPAGPRVAGRLPRRIDCRGFAVSSTASNVSATPAVQSSPWPQTPAATPGSQDSNGGPFAALLDAAAAPDKTHTQAAAPTTPSAADQPAAKFSFG